MGGELLDRAGALAVGQCPKEPGYDLEMPVARLVLLLLFAMPAHTPTVTWRLVPDGWTDVMDCDPTMKPKCVRWFAYPKRYRWELQP
jgi:hypothetical protein